MAQSKDKLILLTLNSHSWQEADNASCLRYAAEAISAEQPHIIALQEINQQENGPLAAPDRLLKSGFADAGFPIVENNWALLLAERLQGYQWCWAFTHAGYKTWHEGVALLSKSPILEVRCADISAPDLPPDSWRRRRVLAIRTAQGWFCSTHMGWWGDEIDPFLGQWQRLQAFTASMEGPCYVMGDFNCPAQTRGEGYDRMLMDGWQDCYARAEDRDGGVTVPGQIDGWREGPVDGLRMDLCMARQPGRTLRSRVIFNGSFHPRVSDHFGVLTWEA